MNFGRFYTETVTLRGDNGATVSGAYKSNFYTKVASIPCSIQPTVGDKTQINSKITMEATHWIGMASKPDGIVNGDTFIDSNNVAYEIIYYEDVKSFFGSYFACAVTMVRE